MTNYNYNRFMEDGVLFKPVEAYLCPEGHRVMMKPCFICHCNEQARKRNRRAALARLRRKGAVSA